VSDAEIYYPDTGTWTATGSLNVSRADAATLLLENGEVLSAGGYNNTGNNNPNTYLTSAELYDPSTGNWTFTSSISGNVGVPTTPVLLTNGDVLIANDAQFPRRVLGSLRVLFQRLPGRRPKRRPWATATCWVRGANVRAASTTTATMRPQQSLISTAFQETPGLKRAQ